MEEIDFTLMSNIAEEVEREHEGLLPFTEMVNILLARYVAAQQSVHPTGYPRGENCTCRPTVESYKRCPVHGNASG